MRYQRIFVLAAFTIALWAGVRATGDELISKESLSKEPFGDLQPFDLSKRAAATGKTDAKESEAVKAAAQPDTNHALQRNPKVAEDILKVNELGDPERIVFEGVKLFPEKELRLALACDLKYQAGARPSNNTSDFLDVLEKRLLEGYLNSGCPDAKVRAMRDGARQVVIAHVDEGQQFRKGQILVTGAKIIREQAIREFLTKPQHTRPWTYSLGGKRLDIFAKEVKEEKESADDTTAASDDPDPVTIWKSGEPIDFRRVDNSQLERGIRFALAELGYADTPFHVELERDAKQGVANVHISVLQETPRIAAADIEVTGLKRDSREALLKYLKLKPGDALTGETLKQLDERLANSCRYWTHKIEVSMPSAPDHQFPDPQAANCKLVLKLEEFSPTPPLGEPLSTVDETMRKCADWLNSLTKNFGSRDLIVTTAAADLGGLVQHAQLVLAAEGTTALDLQLATGDWRIDHSAIVGPHGIELYDWKHNDKFNISRQFSPTAQLLVGATHAEDGEQQSHIAFGYALGTSEKESSSPRFPIEIRVEPAALLRLVHTTPTRTESRDGILTLKQDEVELQVDESTGAIQSLKCAGFLTAGISAVDFRSKPGLAARMIEKIQRRGNDCHNLFDEKNPLGSAATYAIQQMERQPSIQGKPKQRAAWRMLGKVSTSDAFRHLTNPETYSMLESGSTNNTFKIPGQPKFTGENWEELVWYYVPFLADKMFPRGSWPWTYSRELLSFKEEEINRPEGARVHKAHDYGPISCFILAKLWQTFSPNTPDATEGCADEGLHDMSDAALLKDIRLVTQGDRGLAVACRDFAEHCNEMSRDDQDAVVQILPPMAEDIFEKLIARRDAKPNESPAEAIRATMLESWHRGWKDRVEAELRTMTRNAAGASKVSASEK